MSLKSSHFSRKDTPLFGFTMAKYFVKGVLSLAFFASIAAFIAARKPEADQDSTSVSSSYLGVVSSLSNIMLKIEIESEIRE